MPIQIMMPALSPTMEKGKLLKWLVSEGQMVNPGDAIAEIETEKATVEVEAVQCQGVFCTLPLWLILLIVLVLLVILFLVLKKKAP